MSDHTPLGAGREFDAVRAMLARWGDRASGTGDDAAILDVPSGERLLASTDTSVESIHFRRAWMTPDEIGWRATMAALSDLAAMGARPIGLLAAITVPESWRSELSSIADGIGAAAESARCPIVGGDLSAGTELSITVTVLGSTTSPVLRSGAIAGDVLWVTGKLGGPAAALSAWRSGREPAAEYRSRFVRPVARLLEGAWLSEHGARAMIDISDGLVADARHMAAASGLSLTIELDSVPRFDGVAPHDAAASGEEYELLVAAPRAVDASAFQREFGLPLTCVGEVVAGAPEVTVTLGGARVEFAGGHDHFAR